MVIQNDAICICEGRHESVEIKDIKEVGDNHWGACGEKRLPMFKHRKSSLIPTAAQWI